MVPSSTEGFFRRQFDGAHLSPVEAVDETNIKVVADETGRALFFSRSPIPHPKASVDYQFYKHLGVLAYTKEALAFLTAPPGALWRPLEDINELRFIEHGKRLQIDSRPGKSLSVDTPKGLGVRPRRAARKAAKGGDINGRANLGLHPAGRGLCEQLGVWPPRHRLYFG